MAIIHKSGKEAYEADCAKAPNYRDGTPRKTWEQLSEIARWSWGRSPTICDQKDEGR